MSTKIISNSGNSVFAIFIGFEAEITGKILKKRPIFSKNIIEIVSLQYHCSKTEFRVAAVRPVPEAHFTEVWGGGGRTSDLLASLPSANLSGLHKRLERAEPFAAAPLCARSAFYRNRRRRAQLRSARKFAFGKLERTAQVIRTCRAICSSRELSFCHFHRF